jgi:hypothetical protein
VSAIKLARPTRAGYVSLATEHLATVEQRREAPRLLRAAIGRVALDLRREGLAWEHVSVVELSRSGRPHIHFLQRGDPVDPRRLRTVTRNHGAGWADLSPIRCLPVIARYVLKVPISALDLEPEAAEELLAEHRRLNGGRLVTTTRGFWRGLAGESLAGARAARSAAYRAWARSQQG